MTCHDECAGHFDFLLFHGSTGLKPCAKICRPFGTRLMERLLSIGAETCKTLKLAS